MKTGMTTLGCLVGALASLWAAAAGRAVEVDSPYRGLVARNVFALTPLPPSPIQENIKPPPPRLLLAGITTLAGMRLALMKLTVAGSSPGARTQEVPLTLAVGQKAEGVEVLEIHEDEPKWVVVTNNDTLMKLNFTDNGVNLTSAAPPAPNRPQAHPSQPIAQIPPAKHWPPETAMSPEQAAIMEATYRMKYQREMQAGTMPPIPGDNPLLDHNNNNEQAQPPPPRRPH
jgi:hypothetical protein